MRALKTALACVLLAGLACATVVSLAVPSSAQVRMGGPGSEPLPADAETRAAIVDSVSWALNDTYVFPDVAEEIEKSIRKKLNNGEYDDIETIPEFAMVLTEDRRAISNDRHMGVRYATPEDVAEFQSGDDDPKEAERREREQLEKSNFQFREVKILDGNVGYLRLDAFVDASYSGPTAIAAMNFLGYCDALIVDLRQNGGGSPSLIQLLTSYLVEESTHLNSFYIREDDSIHQFWTAAYVPGPMMTDADVYVLTSSYTFSGAEEFTYNLKNMERATIVGETTGGGAHPVRGMLFDGLNVLVRVPYGRAVNPITDTNWEGTGITPHIEVPQQQALSVAHLEALKALKEKASEEDDTFAIDWAIVGLEAETNPVEVSAATLSSYAATYGPRALILEDGMLYYQREDRPRFRAIPMSDTLFRFGEVPYFRLEVVTDDAGRPTKLVGHYDNGRTDESPRSE